MATQPLPLSILCDVSVSVTLMLSPVQADPDPPAARTRSLNPNLSQNLRFSVGSTSQLALTGARRAGARRAVTAPNQA